MAEVCRRNHPLVGANVVVKSDGVRKECRRCNRARDRRRRQGLTGYTDAAACRDHIVRLRAAGMARDAIAERAGVGSRVINRINYGKQQRVTLTTEKAILAVRLVVTVGAVRVSPVGARRRLEALQTQGWSLRQIADTFGLQRNTVQRVMRVRSVVETSTVEQIKQVYDLIWDKQPPYGNSVERGWRDRTKREAAAKGWAPPLAWDDIDDPDEQPKQHVAEPDGVVDEVAVLVRRPSNRAEVEAVIAEMHRRDETSTAIVAAVGRNHEFVRGVRRRLEAAALGGAA